MKPLGRWLPPLLYAAMIFGFSHQPTVPASIEIFNDKVLHFVLYAGLGLLVSRALTNAGASNKISRWVMAAVVASAYGLSDEWHQSFVPGRSVELADWLADTAGGAAGAFIYGKLAAWRKVAF